MNLVTSSGIPADLAASSADILFYATGGCACGTVLVARSMVGVCAILPGDDARALVHELARRFPHSTLVPNEAVVRDDRAKVARYADNAAAGLDLALDMRGTPVQRRVWNAVRSIPFGKTRSCMQVARLINTAYPRLTARIVADACAANPLAFAIPCHRVADADSKLAGYRRDLERRRELPGTEVGP